MKNLLLVLITMTSVSANTCPNISGTYKCIESKLVSNLSIAQNANSITSTIDGQVTTLITSGEPIFEGKSSYTTVCTASRILVASSSLNSTGKQELEQTTISITGDMLSRKHRVTSDNNDSVEVEILCKRI